MKPAIITEEKRRLISRRTRDALQAAKARGVKLGGFTVGSIRNRDEARQRAELLRPTFDELAGMTARGIARELNEREVPLPGRGPWHAMTVIRVQRRLKGKQ
jgi:DNA invertase Pin-like site-specific DNA recombinase